MWSFVLAALLAAPSATTVTPFRTDVSPRVDPVFGDIPALRQSVDRFLELQSEMDQVRGNFSIAVHGTLSQLTTGERRSKRCPPGALAHYGRALVAGGRYLALGRQLELRFREVRGADDLGDIAGLTPDYRMKVKKVRELYLDLLRDYREMKAAFYDQLGAEMRFAGCTLPAARSPGQLAAKDGAAKPNEENTLDPADPTAWELEDPNADKQAALRIEEPGAKHVADPATAAPAIWINVDNRHCPHPSTLAIDGVSLGTVAGRKKTSIRTRAGPREVCVLPGSDKRKCGEPGTIRRAYLYEGWTLIVRCDG